MQFSKSLDQQLDKLHLLNHPFYQSWNEGTLSMDTLKTYAGEYYHHVAAFPRYISGIHSLCDDLQSRQVLLGNLMEEENGDDNHPELWMRFAEGLGVNRDKFQEKRAELKKTNELVDGYFDLVRSSYAAGLGALYAYERQTPEVAKSKIEGLKNRYGITSERTLKFFEEHMSADEWHREEVAALIEKLSDEDKVIAAEGAKKGAQLLWAFLDGIMEKCMPMHAAC